MDWRLIAAGALSAALAGCGDSSPTAGKIDVRNAEQVALGSRVYKAHCASCHGANLEGQPDWRTRRANGRLPAPPHDETGHTWHHPDAVLFAITKNGLVPPYAPAGYESDMPGFGKVLSDDEIWAVLAYIQSRWTAPELLKAREQMVRNARR